MKMSQLKIKSGVRAGAITINHNAKKPGRLKVRSSLVAGKLTANHNASRRPKG